MVVYVFLSINTSHTNIICDRTLCQLNIWWNLQHPVFPPNCKRQRTMLHFAIIPRQWRIFYDHNISRPLCTIYRHCRGTLQAMDELHTANIISTYNCLLSNIIWQLEIRCLHYMTREVKCTEMVEKSNGMNLKASRPICGIASLLHCLQCRSMTMCYL
jgi:hypothetical protein